MKEVRKAIDGKRVIKTKAAVAINCMRRCPAVRLAVSRTPRAKGRINKLMVSIIIRMGTRGVGVPSGKRWPRVVVGWLSRPTIIVINQRGRAKAMFRESWVVGVKVYGSKPKRLTVIRNNISAVKIEAHLWPPVFKGCISWWVNCLINQVCRVNRRLLSQRLVGVRNINQGVMIARAIRGNPSNDGLKNWSKKLRFMVSFRGLV